MPDTPDPDTASVLVSAVQWVAHVLLGTIATSVAILAVATIGTMLLAGRLPVRRGATMIVGCFILFGASSIAQALISGTGEENAVPAPVMPPPVIAPLPAAPAASYDPYLGASAPSAATPHDLFQP